MMYNIFILYVILLLAVRRQNDSVSEEENVLLEELEFPDFAPFMAKFRKYKKDLSDTAKVVFMSEGMESLRNHELMNRLIERMFGFDREVIKMEGEIFSQPDRMELTFNYIDLSF